LLLLRLYASVHLLYSNYRQSSRSHVPVGHRLLLLLVINLSLSRLLPLHAMTGTPSTLLTESGLEEQLSSLGVEVIDSSLDGAPRGERTVVLWNPPLKSGLRANEGLPDGDLYSYLFVIASNCFI